MTQVGLFIIGEPSTRLMKQKIMNELLDLIENDFDKVAFCDDENSNDMLYVFFDIKKQEQIHKLLVKYDILIGYQNLTSDFLFQKNLNPIFNEGDFKDMLIEYLDSHLDSDTVLDKINDMGIKSLNEIDYKVLQK
jgi:hypothetical protein